MCYHIVTEMIVIKPMGTLDYSVSFKFSVEELKVN